MHDQELRVHVLANSLAEIDLFGKLLGTYKGINFNSSLVNAVLHIPTQFDLLILCINREHLSPIIWAQLGHLSQCWTIFAPMDIEFPTQSSPYFLGKYTKVILGQAPIWYVPLQELLGSVLRISARKMNKKFIPSIDSQHNIHTSEVLKPLPPIKKFKLDAIAIGISTGGPMALTKLLPEICKVTQAPILIVQHMPPNFTKNFADSLNKICEHECKEAKHWDLVNPKTIYIAPGAWHMNLKTLLGEIRIELNQEAPLHNCRPAVDALFPSFAQVYGNRGLAMVLTGMGSDGSLSLPELKSSGCTIFAQDKDSSTVWGMPRVAIESGYTDAVLSLMDIPRAIERIQG